MKLGATLQTQSRTQIEQKGRLQGLSIFSCHLARFLCGFNVSI